MKIRNSKQFYLAMCRNGYDMPSEHSALCTMKFMEGVRSGKYFCPETKGISCLPKCYSFPPKSVLLAKLEDFVATVDPGEQKMPRVLALLKAMKKRPADTAFMVKLVAMWTP